MATWSVKPQYKKSIIEREYWEKDGNIVVCEIGWRWGEYHVITEDDNPPKIEAGVDILNCGYEADLVETSDGCWSDYDYDDCDDEAEEWLRNFFEEEDGSPYELEDHGWVQINFEAIIDCDLIIEKVED